MKFPTTGGSHVRDERGKLTQVEAPTKPAPGPGEDLARAPEAPAESEAVSAVKSRGAK